MSYYADIIVDITSEKLDRCFQYRVPETLLDRLEPGMVVEVPFGKGNRIIRGYVIAITTRTEYDPGKIKDIVRIVTDGIGSESVLIGLAVWIRDRYGSTMAQALRTVLPVKKRVREKEQKQICLLLDPEEAREKLEWFRKKNQKARYRLLEALIEERKIGQELVTGKLNISPAVIRAMEEQGIIRIESRRLYRNPASPSQECGAPVCLNEQQRRIADQIIAEWEEEEAGPYLIHGVTGSGKTELYMELISYAVSRGEQAIVLIPEIALTYQTVMRFYRRFGDRVSVINSRLSAGERYDQFERARQGGLDVMIGPRSALFTPFPRLGIIVMDEEHDTAYQSEAMPRYHARAAAMQRGRMERARVVLGSATPSLEAYFAAQTGMLRLFELEERAGNARLPQVSVVDLREELKQGNRSIISRELDEKIRQRLEKREQIMLFLNRRGYAGSVSCRSCGHVEKCPHCDVALSLHNNGKMICHYCGYQEERKMVCPVCGSGFLRAFRAGTQQIEEEVAGRFPQAAVLRMDQDTTREKDGHAAILSAFANHEADILIGTQMIVKGHDFPDVTLVGILNADLSLNVPDYRSAERTFQLLTQAAGRAGRGNKEGAVVIQTYEPDHYSIAAAAKQDYRAFYEQEITFRKMGGYPPAGSLLEIHCSCLSEELLETACNYLKGFVVKIIGQSPAVVLGPVDEPIAKIQDMYRKVIYLKAGHPGILTAVKNRVEQYVAANKGFQPVTIQYERNDADLVR